MNHYLINNEILNNKSYESLDVLKASKANLFSIKFISI